MSDNPNPTPAPNPTPTPAPATPPEKTFTQAELDAIAGNARKEARDKAVSDLLKELGFEKPEDLKTLVTDVRKQQENEKTELEKLQSKLEAAEKLAQEKAAALEQAQQQRLIDRRNHAVLAAARAAKATHPDDVLGWVERYGTEHKVGIESALKEDGTIDDKAVNAMIEAAKKQRPNYFTSTVPGSPSNRDGLPPSNDPSKALGDRKLFNLS